MKKIVILVCMTAVLVMSVGTAMADSIKNRFGVTGRIGFLVPADSDAFGANISTDVGFNGGGGFIYGVTDNMAAELDITHTWFGTNFGGLEFDTTNISLGFQYRFDVPVPHLTPYAGAGLDILVNGVSGNVIQGNNLSVDTVVGVHFCGGVDYFVMKQLALTTELKGVIAPDADITQFGVRVGNFDPMSFSMTFGARYFFN